MVRNPFFRGECEMCTGEIVLSTMNLSLDCRHSLCILCCSGDVCSLCNPTCCGIPLKWFGAKSIKKSNEYLEEDIYEDSPYEYTHHTTIPFVQGKEENARTSQEFTN